MFTTRKIVQDAFVAYPKLKNASPEEVVKRITGSMETQTKCNHTGGELSAKVRIDYIKFNIKGHCYFIVCERHATNPNLLSIGALIRLTFRARCLLTNSVLRPCSGIFCKKDRMRAIFIIITQSVTGSEATIVPLPRDGNSIISQ